MLELKVLRRTIYFLFPALLVLSFQNFSNMGLDVDHRPKAMREASTLQNKPTSTSITPEGEGGGGRSSLLSIPVFPEYREISALALPARSANTGYRSELTNEMLQQKLDSLEKALNFRFRETQNLSDNLSPTEMTVQLLDRNGKAHFNFDGAIKLAYDIDFMKANSELLASKQIGLNTIVNLKYRPQDRNGGVTLSWVW